MKTFRITIVPTMVQVTLFGVESLTYTVTAKSRPAAHKLAMAAWNAHYGFMESGS